MSNVTFSILGDTYQLYSAKIEATKEHDVNGRATSSLTAGFSTVEIVMDEKTTILSEKVDPYSTISEATLTIYNPADGQTDIEVKFMDLFVVDHIEKMSHNTERPSSIFLTISAATTVVDGIELYRADNEKHYSL